MDKRIERAKSKYEKAKAEMDRVVAEVQAACKHEHIACAPYMPMEHFHNLPPYFVCLDCGQSESGNYATSFSRNQNDPWTRRFIHESDCKKITREEAYALRLGPVRRDV